MSKEENEADEHARLLIIKTLKDFVDSAAIDENEREPLAFAGVLIYTDGSVNQQIAGTLNRILINGALQDLMLQVFTQCQRLEAEDAVNDVMQKITLATTPLDPTKGH